MNHRELVERVRKIADEEPGPSCRQRDLIRSLVSAVEELKHRAEVAEVKSAKRRDSLRDLRAQAEEVEKVWRTMADEHRELQDALDVADGRAARFEMERDESESRDATSIV